MKITNKEGLPSGFYNACLIEYVRENGVYSITELNKGVKEILLSRRHEDEMESDCAEMVWSVFGSAVHKVMEMHTVGDDQLSEAAFDALVEDLRVLVKGHIDLFDMTSGTVCDYKTCSVWKVMFGDYKDWKNQLTGYCWLLEKNGIKARKGEIIAMMKDHSKRDAKIKDGYPPLPVKRIMFDITDEDIRLYEMNIHEKIERIIKCDKMKDDEIPECTPEERWAKAPTFAVMKKGRKTALRVLTSMEDAVEWMNSTSNGDFIEKRAGEDKKCSDYCSCSSFCNYYKSNVEGKDGGGE